jgi:hypothetical protein
MCCRKTGYPFIKRCLFIADVFISAISARITECQTLRLDDYL